MSRTNHLAYLSGLLDADGFTGLDDGLLYELRYCMHTGVTSRKVCRWLQDHFGGDFQKVPRSDGTKVYCWKLAGPEASALSRELSGLPPGVRQTVPYMAGVVDAKGFEVQLDPTRLLPDFLAAILPHLVERKKQAKEILETLR